MNARVLAALAVALSGGAALALPAVWWEPLHLDEAITIDDAERSYASIVTDVLHDRGAPAHFFVEHLTLRVPAGIEGLRLPSVVFFLVSLVLACAASLAPALAGDGAGLPPDSNRSRARALAGRAPPLLHVRASARTAWTLASPADRWTRLLLEMERSARRG